MIKQPIRLTAPMLIYGELPPENHEPANRLVGTLSAMESCCTDFAHAVGLKEHCEALRANCDFGSESELTAIRWKLIAVRQAALVLGLFEEALDHAEKHAAKTPALRDLRDHEQARKARKLFRASFKNVHGLRTSVAHGASLAKDDEERAKHELGAGKGSAVHGLKIDGGKHMSFQSLSGDRFFTTVHGGGAFEANQQGVDALFTATEMYFSAYQAAVAHTRDLRIARLRRGDPMGN